MNKNYIYVEAFPTNNFEQTGVIANIATMRFYTDRNEALNAFNYNIDRIPTSHALAVFEVDHDAKTVKPVEQYNWNLYSDMDLGYDNSRN